MDEVTRLALAARSGDAAAVTAFVQHSQTDVRRVIVHLADAGDADDLVQETFLRALRALPGFRGDSSAKTWLLAIARRVAMDELRARHRRRRRDERLRGGAQHGLASDPADKVVLALALESLGTERRMAFVLTQMVGLSYEEAAEVCQCPVGTIRSRVARARGELIALLGGAAAATARGARPG